MTGVIKTPFCKFYLRLASGVCIIYMQRFLALGDRNIRPTLFVLAAPLFGCRLVHAFLCVSMEAWNRLVV